MILNWVTLFLIESELLLVEDFAFIKFCSIF